MKYAVRDKRRVRHGPFHRRWKPATGTIFTSIEMHGMSHRVVCDSLQTLYVSSPEVNYI